MAICGNRFGSKAMHGIFQKHCIFPGNHTRLPRNHKRQAQVVLPFNGVQIQFSGAGYGRVTQCEQLMSLQSSPAPLAFTINPPGGHWILLCSESKSEEFGFELLQGSMSRKNNKNKVSLEQSKASSQTRETRQHLAQKQNTPDRRAMLFGCLG